MTDPEWVEHQVVLAIHESQLAEHGGLVGVRDNDLLESALARPRNQHAYATDRTICHLAAAYAVGICKNHPFLDGNKRTAWVVCATFLEINGVSVVADQADVVALMLGVADGTVSEQEFGSWLSSPGITTSR